MNEEDRPAPGTDLATPAPPAREPIWAHFDAEWYLRRYPDVEARLAGEGFESAEAFYHDIGQRYGHSPNRFFDEEWYLRAHPDVYRAVCLDEFPSGFAHYRQQGYRSYAPHWLFDEAFYRRACPGGLTRDDGGHDYLNGYDHFLGEGDAAGFSGHPFYDPALGAEVLAALGVDTREGGVFATWLDLPASSAESGRLSWYFDPAWYLAHYPAVAKEIAEGRYQSALHHYLANETPRQFDPQHWFSEEQYCALHPDLPPNIEAGLFRNAYDHFVKFGAKEGRAPRADISLAAYMRKPLVAADLRSGVFPDPYAHFVAAECRGRQGWYEAEMPDESRTRALFRHEAEIALPMLRRQKLDFSTDGAPEFSVILVAHDQIAMTMQTLASLRANYAGAIELIVVDSGSRDDVSRIEAFVTGARIQHFGTNIGYLDACNSALAVVSGPAVLYLNNDVRLYPNAVRNALARLSAEPDVGAVGAKIVRTNFRLQEAGSVVWRDGATHGYRREDDPNIAEANFVRDVDFCSAAFLMVRASLLKSLGGYDERFRPAYFEDVDLCLRIAAAGQRVVYDPGVCIEHLEYGSSGPSRSNDMIQANHRLFALIHQDRLRQHPPRHVRNAIFAREQSRERKRILFLEDRLPLPALGSGYVRSNHMVHALVALGYHVTVFAILQRRTDVFSLVEAFPETVELMYDADLGSFAEFIEERAGYYDALWIGRTHNLARLLPILSESARHLGAAGTILDTEVVATSRSYERARVLGAPLPAAEFTARLTDELDCAHFCQRIVAVTEADARLIRSVGYGNVSVLGHALEPRPTMTPFAERRDILALGAIHDEGSPNHDGLMWLIEKVAPFLDALLPEEVRITVAGYVGPDVDLSPILASSRFRWIGPCDDLASLYERHRVFVAPTRFAGGLPYKVHEAASFGLPVVTTMLIAGQVGWRSGEALLAAESDDPEGFAQALARLYHDEGLWQAVRDSALEHVRKECEPATFNRTLDGIVKECVA
ncbi:glycosyltransferase [Acidomonas methanolica]|uniref:glycosyltransferase n=1 Tax=Acidomonas methanolica TaxID=437 RepID=UPI002119EB09|nr:glycosyltransferase [Acidomonas methanolica]MCQ9154469.1 glycosyltransferase [Acidomonas methanolica]